MPPRPLGQHIGDAGDPEPYATGPLDRLLRDVHTAQQHMMFSPKVYEATGRLLLGLEPGLPGY